MTNPCPPLLLVVAVLVVALLVPDAGACGVHVGIPSGGFGG